MKMKLISWLPNIPINLNLSTRRYLTSSAHVHLQNRIAASYYRGGTSRGLIFQVKDLPPSRKDWASIFLGTIGSPDAANGRQLDGLGGGISSLSKICVVGPSTTADADVDFTFVQVGVRTTDIDYSGNCGNLTSAIGPFAIDSGLVTPSTLLNKCDQDGMVTVRILNTNTGKIIDSTFPITRLCESEPGRLSESVRFEADPYGEFSIDGVAGTGSRIQLDFVNPGGSKTGKLLPTGNLVDILDDEVATSTTRKVRATCIDVGNPMVFVPASDLLLDNDRMSPDEISATPGLIRRLEHLRVQATIKMGTAKDAEGVPASIPKICFVSQPTERDEDIDIHVRAISVGQPHKALPITSGLGLAAAAKLDGSVVREYMSERSKGRVTSTSAPPSNPNSNSDVVAIGHPGGKLVVGARFQNGVIERATVYRTARRLMDGFVYWK
ncbi:hypothetical protein FQN57_004669 [Myotisia sp. PD_48]|nr:hypothetical protein FQN57_004669 [Myotisia sp. PD_48]